MSRSEATRCWYCNRRIRWAHCRSWREPSDDNRNHQIIACKRCVSLKSNRTMREWLASLESSWNWPKWGGATRVYAIQKAERYIAERYGR